MKHRFGGCRGKKATCKWSVRAGDEGAPVPLRSVPALVVTHVVCGRLRALATDAARQLDVLGHDGDTLGVDGAQVGVLEQANQVRLGRLLQGKDGGALEAQVRLEHTHTHNDGEGSGSGKWEVCTGRLKHPRRVGVIQCMHVHVGMCVWVCGVCSGEGCAHLLARGLATGGFTGGLLGTGHVDREKEMGGVECGAQVVPQPAYTGQAKPAHTPPGDAPSAVSECFCSAWRMCSRFSFTPFSDRIMHTYMHGPQCSECGAYHAQHPETEPRRWGDFWCECATRAAPAWERRVQ